MFQTLDPKRQALSAGVLCYLTWGLAPLVYQPMGKAGAGPWEIMGHRAFWAVLWAGAIVWLTKQMPEVMKILKTPKTLGILALTTVLISINWGAFVWSVNNGHTLETSLGYYLNPLLNMALGAALFKEKLDKWAKMAIGLAVIGVAFQAIALGKLPIISLVLAVTFGAYGVIRKQVNVSAQTGLFIECLFLALPGAAYIFFIEGAGLGHYTKSFEAGFWLTMAGPMTVVPLVLFSWAARRMPLSTMGFLQFMAPTMSFMIGVSQGEAFTWERAVSFAFIWLGAGVFAYGAWRKARTVEAIEAA